MTTGDLSRARILIIEDNADTRETLGEILDQVGYLVDCAANGWEALDRLRKAPPPAVILLDLMMPVMDGWEFRRLQHEDPALALIPTVVISAIANAGTPPGAAARLTKPIDIQDLLEILSRLCR